MLRLLKDQPVHSKDGNGESLKLVYLIQNLKILDDSECGDCIECDFNPEGVRQMCYKRGLRVLIRKLDMKTWRIWRVA